MEIKIGVKQSPREIVMESDETPKDLAARIEESVKADSLLSFTDLKGRQVYVPAAALAYVEIGTEAARRVGFGA
ncbi:MAG: DUF3107 domain-containing protein [Brevibacterium aurantiacum]|uniref:ATP-binding protein n=1 Tax=Brevibacterium aurantiacum TaxID=273384 RepID=A0A2A3X7W8_BREAU|nr:DUF3107 domain-containing protein [Brevibacterium aurantiacum]MDN5593358.1 DUF3107 domain-containing protein [Brevibacterium sp.]AZL12814.1 DUF3107 domain-containing protein [Brevibacterium aurantiacum]AZT93298.1 DUF3107 domain-containing protein [Brevibacterium aurantiacum]AZT97099.1 DUF3107 domain-containing protein [Brevibacterium aurantiacum]MDN5607375.1 DUF3107 domain-containing protein [Brevibacterium sp.]